jgi:hypothetical protein
LRNKSIFQISSLICLSSISICKLLIDLLKYNSSDTGEKWECNETEHQLFIDFRRAYDLVRKEVLYSILIEFGVPMKIVRLIKVSLNKTYSKVHVGKCLSDNAVQQ